MDDQMNSRSSNSCIDMSGGEEDDQMMDDHLRRGPWTVEEDFTLINYIAHHGEGRWNSLARCAGLKRTGKSCRLRWLNYLRPDVRRGNITLEEQLLILELHSRWGNRWSKIAQHLPGRTDNEIKNYWRTRVQKHAKQLKCDVNSKQFKDTMRYLWMPRLAERIQAATTTTTTGDSSSVTTTATYPLNTNTDSTELVIHNNCVGYENDQTNPIYVHGKSSTTGVSPVSDLTDCYYPLKSQNQDLFSNQIGDGFIGSLISPSSHFNQSMDFEAMVDQNHQGSSIDFSDHLWNVEDFLYLQQQFDKMESEGLSCRSYGIHRKMSRERQGRLWVLFSQQKASPRRRRRWRRQALAGRRRRRRNRRQAPPAVAGVRNVNPVVRWRAPRRPSPVVRDVPFVD